VSSGETAGSGADAPGPELDLSSEPDLSPLSVISTGLASQNAPPLGAPRLKKNRWDDAARVILAFILVGLLAFVVIATTISAVTGTKSQEAVIESYLKIVLSPIIGIVGSVVGFYFGAKSQSTG
jgi:hypothetical protein